MEKSVRWPLQVMQDAFFYLKRMSFSLTMGFTGESSCNLQG